MTDLFDELFTPAEASAGRFFGVVIGVVSNSTDPDDIGRVKLKLPWLAADAETDWARVSTPMAGPQRGLYLLPEVEDEVLVAFLQGSVQQAVVIGSLWNGKDKPPVSNADGKNDVRELRSRSGAVIRLTDTKDAEKIEIVDRTQKNSITILSKENSVTIVSEGDVTVTAKKKLVLSGDSVEITAKQGLKVAGNKAEVTAQGQFVLKGQTVAIN